MIENLCPCIDNCWEVLSKDNKLSNRLFMSMIT